MKRRTRMSLPALGLSIVAVAAAYPAAGAAAAGGQVLVYADRDRRVHAVDADSGQRVSPRRSESESFATMGIGPQATRPVRSPVGARSAILGRRQGPTELIVFGHQHGPRSLFSGPGRLTGPTWSPDGRWILVGWRDADQWLFINADRPRRVVAFDNITAQFGGTAFPRVAGWVLPQR